MALTAQAQRNFRIAVTICGVGLFRCTAANAQAGHASPATQSSETIYVHENGKPDENVVRASKMEQLKDWDHAGGMYQEVLQKFNDWVVPTGVNANKATTRYGNIKGAIRDRLAAWPKEGIDAYRARYESDADAMLAAARADDVEALGHVFDMYFMTDAGKQAGLRLIESDMDCGDFESAARVGDQLLHGHPSLKSERPIVLYETALSYHFSGDEPAAKATCESLKSAFPTARGIVRGMDVILADSLSAEMQAPVAAPSSQGADSWRLSVGGNPSRNEMSSAQSQPQARVYAIAIAAPRYTGKNKTQIEMADKQFGTRGDHGPALGIMPATDRGELYFQDSRRMYAVSIETGSPLPGWSRTYPDTGQFELPDANGIAPEDDLSVTLTDRSALAIMGQPDRLGQLGASKLEPGIRLVCLDRQTGKANWIASAKDLPQAQAGLRTLQLIGSPLVVKDRVLVEAATISMAGFEDCYLLCFDLTSGSYQWNCHLADANTAPISRRYFEVPTDGVRAFSPMAFANGRVYVQTNLGVLASIDVSIGSVAWLDLYPTNGLNIGSPSRLWIANRKPGPIANKAWMDNPVIVDNRTVFTLPRDSDYLLIYDTNAGSKLKRINLKEFAADPRLAKDARNPLNFGQLLAVNGDRVILLGQFGHTYQLACVDWKKNSAGNTALVWCSAPIDSIEGRCFLTRDSVFVPTATHLARLDRATGESKEDFPRASQWNQDAGEGPGNVLATGDRVILAGDRHVTAYGDLSPAASSLKN